MDHLELLDGGLFAESSLLDDIPAQKPRSADLADLPMSAAGGMPVPIALKVDVGQIVTACTNAYRDVAVNQEIQRTEREKVRQLARIQITQIEADTQRYLGRLLIKKEERMAIISQLSGLLTKEKIDAEVATLVKYLLQYLLQDSQNLQYLGDSHRN